VTGNDAFLKDKAKLLITRERELLAMRRKYKRLASWLPLARRLAELVDPRLPLSEVCARVSDGIVAALDLQTVAFFELEGTSLRPIVRSGEVTPQAPIELDADSTALIASDAAAVCQESSGPAQDSLCRAVGLHRFLWHRMAPAGARAVLFVAGYDRERAPFFAPFDEDDIAHFANTAHQLALLLGNNNLVRELQRDKQMLLEFNVELERRVDSRTAELAATNRSLEQVLENLRQKDQRLADDIQEARVFQQKMLAEAPRSERIEFATVYRPLERVGGDVFDVYYDDRLACFRIFLADVTGHGVQASMRTILIKTEYDRLKVACAAPHMLLEELNRRLVILFPGGEIMCTGSCVDVALDDQGACVTYANAGNPPLLHWSGRPPAQIYGDSPFLGIGDPTWPDSIVFRMAPGDVLVVATDGLTEQRNERGEAFEEAVIATAMPGEMSGAQCVEWLVRTFDAFRGDTPLSDDLTLVGLRIPTIVRVTRPR
jgi:serine phosphatase RsbU (regulator of sigma subunit)